jgi:hypothetical protein
MEMNRNKLQKILEVKMVENAFSRSENKLLPTLEMTCKIVSKLQERERGEHIC